MKDLKMLKTLLLLEAVSIGLVVAIIVIIL